MPSNWVAPAKAAVRATSKSLNPSIAPEALRVPSICPSRMICLRHPVFPRPRAPTSASAATLSLVMGGEYHERGRRVDGDGGVSRPREYDSRHEGRLPDPRAGRRVRARAILVAAVCVVATAAALVVRAARPGAPPP